MKITFLVLLTTTLFCFSSYADDAPTFIKVGGTYALTAAPGIVVPHIVIIAASGGGGWFRVTTPKETGPGPHRAEDPSDVWINFNHVAIVREPSAKTGK
jgi:hypothetical protein